MVAYSLRLPKHLHRKLKAVAEANGISVNALISGAVLACADAENPDRPLIVGSSDNTAEVRTRKVR